MTNRRLKPKVRRDQILNAAVRAAEKHHYQHVTRQQVADVAACAPALVSNYFGDMRKLRRRIMRTAIATENLVIVLQGLSAGDPLTHKAPEDLKHKAINQLNNK